MKGDFYIAGAPSRAARHTSPSTQLEIEHVRCAHLTVWRRQRRHRLRRHMTVPHDGSRHAALMLIVSSSGAGAGQAGDVGSGGCPAQPAVSVRRAAPQQQEVWHWPLRRRRWQLHWLRLQLQGVCWAAQVPQRVQRRAARPCAVCAGRQRQRRREAFKRGVRLEVAGLPGAWHADCRQREPRLLRLGGLLPVARGRPRRGQGPAAGGRAPRVDHPYHAGGWRTACKGGAERNGGRMGRGESGGGPRGAQAAQPAASTPAGCMPSIPCPQDLATSLLYSYMASYHECRAVFMRPLAGTGATGPGCRRVPPWPAACCAARTGCQSRVTCGTAGRQEGRRGGQEGRRVGGAAGTRRVERPLSRRL